MKTTEALLSYTTKVNGGDLLTARGDSEEEFNASFEAMLRIKARIEGSTPAPAAAPTMQQAVATVTAAIPGSVQVSSIGSETRQDQYGNSFLNGVMNVGSCAHGPRVLAKRTNKEGKDYERWECINNTPFRVGKYDANAICKHEYPPKAA